MSTLPGWSPRPLGTYTYRFLLQADRPAMSSAQRILLYVFPAGVGLLVATARPDSALVLAQGAAAAVLALYSAVLVATTIGLRVQIARSRAWRGRAWPAEKSGAATAATLYIGLLCSVLTVVLAVVSALPGPVIRIGLAGGAAVLIHVSVCLAVVTRRVFGVYLDLFEGDFLAKPDPMSGGDDAR
ncbi:hypothetical protein [Nocardia sp. IFM 10818]